MTPGSIADSIVNLCGAIGIAIAMASLYRRDPKNALTSRFLVALALVLLLFLARGLAWWSGNARLDSFSSLPAALLPVGALIVTEGMLRRHAPRAAKLAFGLLGAGLGIGGVLGLDGYAAPYALTLSAFLLGTIAYCALLLATRDRASLTAAENQSINRLAIGALAMLPFLLTDFRTLFPDIPVRLGGLGVLLLVTAVMVAGGGEESARHHLLLSVLRIISGALLGAAASWMSPGVDAAQLMRFCVVAVSGVLAIGLMVDALRSVFEARAPGILNSVARSAADTREALIAELARHPIFASARRYRERDLAAYDPPLLRDFLAQNRVLRRPEEPWGKSSSDPAVERLTSLMRANTATHLIVLSHDPVDVIVLTVPITSADPATETAIALVRRLLVLVPEQRT
jgi:hypothetical protein